MNEHRVNEFSHIKGKNNTYIPFDFVESADDNYTITDSIAVFSEPVGFLERRNFKVSFYEIFNKENFKKDTDRTNHTVYFINPKSNDIKEIISDIEQGEFFTY